MKTSNVPRPVGRPLTDHGRGKVVKPFFGSPHTHKRKTVIVRACARQHPLFFRQHKQDNDVIGTVCMSLALNALHAHTCADGAVAHADGGGGGSKVNYRTMRLSGNVVCLLMPHERTGPDDKWYMQNIAQSASQWSRRACVCDGIV